MIEPRYSRVASGAWPDRLAEARDILVGMYDGKEPDGTLVKGGLWLFFTNLRPVRSENLPYGTLAVDAYWRLFWTPKYVEDTPLPRLAASLMHEANHLLRQHPDRFSDLLERIAKTQPNWTLGGPDTKRLWNFAADAEINARLRAKADLDLGENWVYPESFGMSGTGNTAEAMFWFGASAGMDQSEQDLEQHKRIACGLPGRKKDEQDNQKSAGGKPQQSGQGDPAGQPRDAGDESAGTPSGKAVPGRAGGASDRGQGDSDQPGVDESDSGAGAVEEAAGEADGGDRGRGGDPAADEGSDDAGQSESDAAEGDDPGDPDDDQPGDGAESAPAEGAGDDGLDGGGEPVDGCGGWAVFHEDLPEEMEREAAEQDVPRLPKEVVDEVLDDVAREMTRPDSGTSGGSRGEGSSDTRMWAEARLAGRYRWDTVLLQFLGKALEAAGSSDFTFKRPSRRAASTPGIILPKTISRKPELVIVMDTSGSMRSPEIQNWLLAEMKNIARLLGTPVVVGYCDARMLGETKVDGSTVRINAPGGGGTDMRVGIAWAEEHYPRAVATVVLTDGITPWPATRGKRPLVIGLFGTWDQSVHYKAYCPAWSKTVIIAKPENL